MVHYNIMCVCLYYGVFSANYQYSWLTFWWPSALLRLPVCIRRSWYVPNKCPLNFDQDLAMGNIGCIFFAKLSVQAKASYGKGVDEILVKQDPSLPLFVASV